MVFFSSSVIAAFASVVMSTMALNKRYLYLSIYSSSPWFTYMRVKFNYTLWFSSGPGYIYPYFLPILSGKYSFENPSQDYRNKDAIKTSNYLFYHDFYHALKQFLSQTAGITLYNTRLRLLHLLYDIEFTRAKQ